MRCKDVMSPDVAVVGIDDTLEAAARLMRERRVGFLPVCEPDGRALGAVTDRDLVVRGLADGGRGSAPVGVVMTREVVACGPTDDLDLAEALMAHERKSRIMVCDEEGRVVGVVSLSDVAQREASQAAATLRHVIDRDRAASGVGPSPRTVDVMKRDVVCVGPEAPASQAAQLMRDKGVGFVPVCRADGKLVGVVTDRDLAVRVIAEGRDPSTPVRELMNRDVVACEPGDELARAGALMAKHRKSRLPVRDACDHVVGVLSLSDVLRHTDGAATGRTLRRISSREAGRRRVTQGLEGRSRQQLYAMARRLDVAGRSTMPKRRLIDAIRAAR